MSNTDSFIEEVTEEVRRDRLFIVLRKYAWIGILAVLVIVGGAAYNEYRKANARAQAQAVGDALLTGMQADDDGATLSALNVDTPTGTVLAQHLTAADALDGDARDTAITALEAAAASQDTPAIYSQLAQLKLALALPPETDADTRLAALDALIAPGAPFALLAQEQKALIAVEQGDNDAAIAQFQAILDDSAATPGLQRRASELIVALGGTLGDS